MLLTGMLWARNVSGDSAIAMNSSTVLARMFPALMSRPPDATADARSTPCFCRNRICAAIPPTAGIARFENDIDSWSSLVRHNGRLIGTVPMSAIAVAQLVANEISIAAVSHQRFGARDRVPERLRVADLGEQHADREQRADRHHEVRAAHPVQLLEGRRLGAVAAARGGAEVADALVERLALAGVVRPQSPCSARPAAGPGARRRPRRRPRPRSAAATARSSPTIVRGAEQQLGDISRARSSAEARPVADSKPVTATPSAVSTIRLRVQRTVGDVRGVQGADPLPELVEHGVGDLGGVDVAERAPVERPGSRAVPRPGPAVPATTTAGTGTPARCARSST